MYYELYIDVFFLENFVTDTLLLYALSRVLKRDSCLKHAVAGGAAGSLMTCIIIVLPLPPAVKWILFHFAVCPLMLRTGLGSMDRSTWVRSALLLYMGSFLTGGVMQALYPMQRGMLWFSLMICVGCGIFSFLSKLIGKITEEKETEMEVTLVMESGTCKVRGLWDTGNRMYDALTGDPVSVLDPVFAAEHFPIPEDEKGFHYAMYRTVGKEGVMKVFRIKKMCIHSREDKWVASPLLGIGEIPSGGEGGYEIILNPGILSQ